MIQVQEVVQRVGRGRSGAPGRRRPRRGAVGKDVRRVQPLIEVESFERLASLAARLNVSESVVIREALKVALLAEGEIEAGVERAMAGWARP